MPTKPVVVLCYRALPVMSDTVSVAAATKCAIKQHDKLVQNVFLLDKKCQHNIIDLPSIIKPSKVEFTLCLSIRIMHFHRCYIMRCHNIMHFHFLPD